MPEKKVKWAINFEHEKRGIIKNKRIIIKDKINEKSNYLFN